MRTYMPKKEDIKREWYLIDAKGKTLGRLASFIARILMGKGKPSYTPHLDLGDGVIVINADQIRVTGKKMENKLYRWHTGYLGGLRTFTLREMLSRNPQKVLYLAVKGMLPKNKLRASRLKRLKIYIGSEHPHQAQLPKPIELEEV